MQELSEPLLHGQLSGIGGPLSSREVTTTSSLWNVGLLPHHALLGVLHNTSRVHVNLTSGQVHLPCPRCDSLTALGAANLPLEPFSVEGFGQPHATRPRALLRMDPPMDPASGRPLGSPVLYDLDAASGKVEAACLLPRNLSFGAMFLSTRS